MFLHKENSIEFHESFYPYHIHMPSNLFCYMNQLRVLMNDISEMDLSDF